jgi:acetyl-CoA synthetase
MFWDAVLTLADLADRHAGAGHAGRLALRWRGRDGRKREFTYGDLSALSDRLAGHLLERGIAPGQTVGVMLGRQPETVIAALAVWKVGGLFCPLFADLGPDLLRARLDVAQVRLLMASPDAVDHAVTPLQEEGDFSPILWSLGDVQALLERDAPDIGAEPDTSKAGLLHFTSGTTAPQSDASGQPRAILHDGRFEPRLVDSAVQALGLGAGDLIWPTGEPGWVVYSAFGLVAPLAVGAAILLDEPPPTPTRCLTVLEDEPIDVWYTTPTIVRSLMGAGAAVARSIRRPRLRVAATAGEPLSADAVEWGERAFGTPFRDNWWQTETGGVVLAGDLIHRPQPGSMGRPLPGLRVELVRRNEDDTLEFLPDGAAGIGEMAVRLEGLAPWKSLGGESGAPPEDVDGWHYTHDIARRDEDGNFWFIGRADEVINLSGRLVGPFEVEAVLMSHPAVAEAGVVGGPDADGREHLVAFVGLNPGFDPVRALRDELHLFAVEHLGSILAPDDIRFELCLPRTSSGKIVRRILKARIAEP